MKGKKEFTTSQDSAEEVNNVFNLSDGKGFKQTEMKPADNGVSFGNQKLSSRSDKLKEGRILKKVSEENNGDLYKANDVSDDVNYNIPEFTKKSTESDWAKKAADIAGSKIDAIENYEDLKGARKKAADFQIESTTKQDIANLRAQEAAKIASETPQNTISENQELPDYSSIPIGEKAEKEYAKSLEKQDAEAKKEADNLSKARSFLENPGPNATDEQIFQARRTVDVADENNFIKDLKKQGITDQTEIDNRLVAYREDRDYKRISDDYVRKLNEASQDPYAGEWARNELDAFNYQNKLAEQYPTILSKKTSSDILKQQMASRAHIENLKKQGQEREAKRLEQIEKEKSALRKQLIFKALSVAGVVAARLIPLLYLPSLTTRR